MAKQPSPAMKKSSSTIVVEAYCPSCEKSYPEALEACPDDGVRLVRLTQQEVELVGTRFDNRFEILGFLGDGGMGAVYRARELAKNRDVAIKVIRTELTNDIKVAKRFLREAKVSSGVEHPNTVGVYDYGQTVDGILYLTMELLQGQTLEDVMAESGGRMDPVRVCRICIQIFDALEAAHKQGVIHRDLKPSNIMVAPGDDGEEVVKVLDFGLAKSLGSDFNTTAGFLMGTPAYLAPEIILRGDINFASDLYAVGVLMYEVIAGHVPFEDEEIPSVLMAHAHRPPPPLPDDVPQPIASFVLQLLKKKPVERFASARAARQGLMSTLEELPRASEDVATPAVPHEIVETAEMDMVAAPEAIDWEDADEDAGTIRSAIAPPSKPVTSSDRVTAPREQLDPVSAREALGKAKLRRRFATSKTKLLTPVPPLTDMRAEILSAVAGDEDVTREMVALLDADTDEVVNVPEDDGDTTPFELLREDPRSDLATTRMPRQDQQALLRALSSDESFDDPVVGSTAVVGRDQARAAARQARAMAGRQAAQDGGSSPLMWILFALIGAAVGVGVWWFLEYRAGY